MTECQLAALIEEGAAIKAAITENTKRLREIGVILADHAVFPDGKNTAHMAGSSHKATIQRKETISWDQDALNHARSDLGDQEFFQLFGWEFKPKAKKDLDGFLAHSSHADIVRQAMIIKQASPSVTFAALEG